MRSLLLLAFLFPSFIFAQSAWLPGEVLVYLAPAASAEQVSGHLKATLPSGLELTDVAPLGSASRYHRLVFGGADLPAGPALERIVAQVPGVLMTSLNYALRGLAQPNDPQYGDQWNMASINVEPVWDLTTGGSMSNGHRIAVGIVDELVQTTHPDLSGNIGAASPYLGPGETHGTEVAGVVGAVGNNGIGLAGVSWDVDLLSLGGFGSLGGSIEGFEAALALRELFNASGGSDGALVVSVTASWTVPGTACGFGDPLFQEMAEAGILVITAGDNAQVDLDNAPEYPSSCPNANNIVVTTIGEANEMPFAFGNSTVHLFAPGLAIPTTEVGGGYVSADGNSFAVPHVAGAVALLYANDCPQFAALVMSDPEAAAMQVKQALLTTVSPVPGGGARTITGGKLNVAAAYNALVAACPGSCDEYSITLTTDGGTPEHFILDGIGTVVASGTGSTFTTCLALGCYDVLVLDSEGALLPGTYAVEDAQGALLGSGSHTGRFLFPMAGVIGGCTDPNACNFDPNANCPSGLCFVEATWYADADGDGFGDDATAAVHCVPPAGTVLQGGDCDDTDPAITAIGAACDDGDAQTSSDTMDGDCNCVGLPIGTCPPGEIPDCNGNCAPASWVGDDTCDNGSFDWNGVAIFFNCIAFDNDGGDCNGCVPELCDGEDNDCDGLVDEDFIWYTDNDGDGFGATGSGQVFCTPPTGMVQVEGDCDDSDPALQNGFRLTVFAFDAEDGSAHYVITQGATILEGDLALVGADNGAGELPVCIGSGCFSIQITPNDVPLWEQAYLDGPNVPGDNDEFDIDDGFFGSFSVEVCDGIDNDCDGTVDEDFIWYIDADGDGLGDDATQQISCTPLPGGVQVGGDCNDTTSNITTIGAPCDDGDPNTQNDIVRSNCNCAGDPVGGCAVGEIPDCNGNCAPAEWVGDGACDDGSFVWNGIPIFFDCEQFGNDGGDCGGPCTTEVCDGLDNDCDGVVDNGFIWYIDADGDGFGDDASAQISCTPMSGRVQVGGDCDDSLSTITIIGAACDDGDPNTVNDIIGPDCACAGSTGGCPPGEVADCNGNCAPEDWIGDGFCDEGTFLYNGFLIDFSCAQFGDDGGDCGPPCTTEVCDGIDNDCNGIVDDGFPGVMACPANLTFTATEPNCSASITYDAPELSCGNGTIERFSGPAVGDVLGVGNYTVSYGLLSSPATQTIFYDTFLDNNAGWQLDAEWEIGITSTSEGCDCGEDPVLDHTAGPSNGVAGMVLGGCVESTVHGFRYLTSPAVDVSVAIGTVHVEFWRHLHADYAPYMEHVVEVFDGAAWQTIWTNTADDCLNDAQWTRQVFDVTPYANAAFRVRFGQAVTDGSAFNTGGWSIDDVAILGSNSYDSTCSFQLTVEAADDNNNSIPDCAETELCTDYILEFQSGATLPQTVSYNVLNESGTATVLSGNNPVPANSIGTLSLCLVDGCYQLRVTDAAGDGLAGYVLRESGPNGRRFIDNTANMSTGASQIANGGTFCVPMGNIDLIYSNCDKMDWVNNKYLVCHADPAVSAVWVPGGANNVQNGGTGYAFWVFDPNGSYSFRRFHAHNTSDGYSPATATRAAHLKLNGWSNGPLTPHVPANVLMNLRVRPVVLGSLGEWGPACRMMIDPTRAACPLVNLQDDPANPSDYSCGVTRVFGGPNASANRIVADPPQFQPAPLAGGTGLRYQFRFRIPGENVCIVRPPQTSPTLFLNWNANSGPQLEASKTYEVEVRVSKDQGATWCVDAPSPACDPSPVTTWGKSCNVTISGVVQLDGGSSNLAPNGNGTLTMYPNPNNGDQLFISLTELAPEVNTVSVDIYDLAGKRITARTIAVQASASRSSGNGFLNTAFSLNGDVASGLYMVNITAGDKTYTERLVIQK